MWGRIARMSSFISMGRIFFSYAANLSLSEQSEGFKRAESGLSS